MSDQHPIIDFGKHGVQAWAVVNDVVMGGVSRSTIRSTTQGTAVFHGDLSLENSGGFASVRTSLKPRALMAFSGLELRIKGDGRDYQLRLRTNTDENTFAYRAVFATRPDEWMTVWIPFRDFEPAFRGQVLDDATRLDPAEVRQLGFLLADRQPGAFSLEIETIAGRFDSGQI